MDDAKQGDALLKGIPPKKRTKSGRIRELLPEIEAARERGATHTEILTMLNELGLDLKFRAYMTLVSRAREREKRKAPLPPGEPNIGAASPGKNPNRVTDEVAQAETDKPDSQPFQVAESDPFGALPSKDSVAKKFETYQSSNSLLNRKKTGES